MPNGFHGPEAEWKRLETPLLRIDEVLTSFAKGHGLTVSANYHNWPERSLVSTSKGLRKLIQIHLEDEGHLTLTFWMCASEDRGKARFWKQQSEKRRGC